MSSQIECIFGAGRQNAWRALTPRSAPTGVTPPCQRSTCSRGDGAEQEINAGHDDGEKQAKPQWVWN